MKPIRLPLLLLLSFLLAVPLCSNAQSKRLAAPQAAPQAAPLSVPASLDAETILRKALATPSRPGLSPAPAPAPNPPYQMLFEFETYGGFVANSPYSDLTTIFNVGGIQYGVRVRLETIWVQGGPNYQQLRVWYKELSAVTTLDLLLAALGTPQVWAPDQAQSFLCDPPSDRVNFADLNETRLYHTCGGTQFPNMDAATGTLLQELRQVREDITDNPDATFIWP